MTDRVQAIIDLIDGVLDNPTQRAGDDTPYYMASEKCWRCEERRPAKDSNVGLCAQCKAELAEERPMEPHSEPPPAPPRFRNGQVQIDSFTVRDNDGWPEAYTEFETWESFNPRLSDRRAHAVAFDPPPAVATGGRSDHPSAVTLLLAPRGPLQVIGGSMRQISVRHEPLHSEIVIGGYRYLLGAHKRAFYHSGHTRCDFHLLDDIRCDFRLLDDDTTRMSFAPGPGPRGWQVRLEHGLWETTFSDICPLPGVWGDAGRWTLVPWNERDGWGRIYIEESIPLPRALEPTAPVRAGRAAPLENTGRLVFVPETISFAWLLRVASDG